MPQLAPITVNDGAATPVAHTFSPVTTDGYAAQLAERTSVPVGNRVLSTSVRPPVSGNGLYKVRFLLKVPATKMVDGIAMVDHTNTVDITMSISERSEEQARKDLRVLASNLLTNAAVITMVEKLEPQY